jgi:hypothetical protein
MTKRFPVALAADRSSALQHIGVPLFNVALNFALNASVSKGALVVAEVTLAQISTTNTGASQNEKQQKKGT